MAKQRKKTSIKCANLGKNPSVTPISSLNPKTEPKITNPMKKIRTRKKVIQPLGQKELLEARTKLVQTVKQLEVKKAIEATEAAARIEEERGQTLLQEQKEDETLKDVHLAAERIDKLKGEELQKGNSWRKTIFGVVVSALAIGITWYYVNSNSKHPNLQSIQAEAVAKAGLGKEAVNDDRSNKIKELNSSKREKIEAFIKDKNKTTMSLELTTFPERLDGPDGWKDTLTSYFRRNGQNVIVVVDVNSGKQTADYDYIKDKNGQTVKIYYVKYIVSIEKLKEKVVEPEATNIAIEKIKSIGTGQEINVTTPMAVQMQPVEKSTEKIVDGLKEKEKIFAFINDKKNKKTNIKILTSKDEINDWKASIEHFLQQNQVNNFSINVRELPGSEIGPDKKILKYFAVVIERKEETKEKTEKIKQPETIVIISSPIKIVQSKEPKKEKVKTEPIMKKEQEKKIEKKVEVEAPVKEVIETLSETEEARYSAIINKYEMMADKKSYGTFKKVAEFMRKNKNKAETILKTINEVEEYLKSKNPNNGIYNSPSDIGTVKDMLEISVGAVE